MPLIMKKTINGQPVKIRLTADTGAGNPVGTIIVVCSNQIPSNYLPLGTQYDTSLYPVLYALLGTDTTPTASALGLPTLTSGQYAIKATSGLSENAQDNVINTLNDQRSFSIVEHKTGKKWIDGKDIWEITIDCGTLPNATTKSVATGITNISNIISIKGIANTSDANTCVPIPYVSINPNDTSLSIACYYSVGNINLRTFIDMTVYTQTFITLEYTKTTD